MSKPFQEIKDDLDFIKSHTMQPQWYKVLKVFILIGFLVGYYCLFGFMKTVIFFAVFMFLMLLVHLIYRIKTNKFRRSWLDFVVEETPDGVKAQNIGKFYYIAILLNTLLAIIISQIIPG
jgi:Ca2+-dependent lipid-binding protein